MQGNLVTISNKEKDHYRCVDWNACFYFVSGSCFYLAEENHSHVHKRQGAPSDSWTQSSLGFQTGPDDSQWFTLFGSTVAFIPHMSIRRKTGQLNAASLI